MALLFMRRNQNIPENREYEKSGLYPKNGKPFRLWALLGGLTLVIAMLAGVSALLNFILV